MDKNRKLGHKVFLIWKNEVEEDIHKLFSNRFWWNWFTADYEEAPFPGLSRAGMEIKKFRK